LWQLQSFRKNITLKIGGFTELHFDFRVFLRGNIMKGKSSPRGRIPAVFILLGILFTLLISCQQADRQKKHYLIGIINPNAGTQDINRGFVDQLQENGFSEGENTTYLRYDSDFEMDEVIHDMITRKADLIFTVTTPATRKAIKAARNKNIPVIFSMQDPVSSGIIKSLANPGGDATGVQIRGSVPKTVEWMLAVSPGLKHFFVPIKYDTKAADQSLEDLQKTADALGIKLTIAEVNDQSELSAALANIPENADAIFILCSIFIHSNVEKLVQAAIDRKLLIGSGAAQSDRGVTVSYGMLAEKTGRQAGRMADLILHGRSPTDIPVEIADFFIGINLKTAQKSGIQIPLDVLQQADEIIR
jgi:putative ABC transport system substrate-binding protein